MNYLTKLLGIDIYNFMQFFEKYPRTQLEHDESESRVSNNLHLLQLTEAFKVQSENVHRVISESWIDIELYHG